MWKFALNDMPCLWHKTIKVGFVVLPFPLSPEPRTPVMLQHVPPWPAIGYARLEETCQCFPINESCLTIPRRNAQTWWLAGINTV